MAKKSEKEKEELEQEMPQDGEEQQTASSENDNGEQKQEAEESANDPLITMKEKYLRLVAEFDNYKKRTNRERINLINTAGESTILKLLPILDDFDRAKNSAEDEKTDEVFTEGVHLVYDKLYKILGQMGLSAMESNQKEFNPELHEAITKIPVQSDDMKGKIVDTIEKGYMLHDKIIRHAKVVVGN